MVKCSNFVSMCTRSKKPVLLSPLTFERKRIWISATKVKNYFCDDRIVDWLSIKHHKEWASARSNQPDSKFELVKVDSTNELFNLGHAFEDTVINYIKTKYNVISVSNIINDESCEKSKKLLLAGVPILHSVPIRNYYNNTRGIIDLVVRSDYVNKLFQEKLLSEHEEVIKASKLNGPYHYIAFDIKYSTIPLSKKDNSILNVKLFPTYKSQLWTYTQALSYVQGYTSQYAFIIGRRMKKTGISDINTNMSKHTRVHKHFYYDINDNIKFEPMKTAAKIDFQNKDQYIITKTRDALKWLRNIVQNGDKWTIEDLFKKNIYPNMCIDSGIYNAQKQNLAKDIGEISSLWYCGKKERDNALGHGVTSWRDYKCTAEILGVKGKRGEIINRILEMNRQSEISPQVIWPSKIHNNLFNWKTIDFKGEVFVDFETINDAFISNYNFCGDSDFVFMIGIGWKDYTNNSWNIHHIISKDLSYEEESRCLSEFYKFISERNFPKIWYYCVEESIIKRKFKKYNIPICNMVFSDLYKIFIETPIIIQGCLNFKLKEIGDAMFKHNMISLQNNSNTTNGLNAMINAARLYSENNINSPIMNDIKKYNEFDCRLLEEIITYLRKNKS